MMRQPEHSTGLRLAAEVALILVGLCAIMFALGRAGGFGIDSAGSGPLGAALVAVLAWPLVLWRLLAARRRWSAERRAASEAVCERAGRLTIAAAGIILAVGVGVSALLASVVHGHDRSIKRLEFERRAAAFRESSGYHLEHPLRDAIAFAGLFRSSTEVEGADFTRFFETLHDGHSAVGFAAYIEREAPGGGDRAPEGPGSGAAASGPASGAADGSRYVVRMREGACRDLVDVATDISTDAELRRGAERAMRAGEPAFSVSAAWAHGGAGASQAVWFVPLYGASETPASEEDRVRSLVGWIAVGFRLDLALGYAADQAGDLVDLEVYAGRTMDPAFLVFDRDGFGHGDAGAPPEEDADSRTCIGEARFELGGAELTVWMGTTPAFDAAHGHDHGGLIFLGGLLLFELLATTVWLFGHSRRRALELAEELTATVRGREWRIRALLAQQSAFRRCLDRLVSVEVTDLDGRVLDANDQFLELCGYSREELVGRDHRMLSSGRHSRAFWEQMFGALRSEGSWRGLVCNRAKDGREFWTDTTIGVVCDGGEDAKRYLVVRVDVTAQVRQQEALHRAAFTDELTGLDNRALLMLHMESALAGGSREGLVGLLALDVDRFAQINDTLGHGVGDAVLLEVAARLTAACGAHEAGGVSPSAARISGDGFAVLLPDMAAETEGAGLAERIQQAFSEPFRARGFELFLTVSVGIATARPGETGAEDLLRSADIALGEAKLAGRGRTVAFEARMADQVHQRVNVEHELRGAMDRGEIFLAYQPIVSLESGHVRSFEALVRWRHPVRGNIRPDEFIPIAEQSGLIIPLGAWILREACAQLARWRAELGRSAPPYISVNLSRIQLMQHDLPETIRSVLRETGLPAGSLVLEVTETAAMRDAASGSQMLRAIRGLGVRLSLDDFGTGHSSLASLHEMPVEVLKIDRSFVANLSRGRRFVALVEAAVRLAENLGMTVVAEGVETEEQVATLQAMGCGYAQGYRFGKAMTPGEAAHLLAERAHTPRRAA